MEDIKDVTTGVILAGGRGSRMDGKDKGLLHFSGFRLVEHVIKAIAPQVKTLIINANRNIEEYQSYGYPVISDHRPDFAGPLAGIEAALCITQTPYLITAPCDTPKLPDDLVVRLAKSLVETDSDLAVADDGRRIHPVFCLMKTTVLESLQKQLESGERKIDRWFEKIDFTRCDFSDTSDAFHNVNTPQDLVI